MPTLTNPWHQIPRELPADGTTVIVKDGRLGQRVARWDAHNREWWGTRVDGQPVDWRASMAVFDVWRV